MGALRRLITEENNGSRDAPTADYPRDAGAKGRAGAQRRVEGAIQPAGPLSLASKSAIQPSLRKLWKLHAPARGRLAFIWKIKSANTEISFEFGRLDSAVEITPRRRVGARELGVGRVLKYCPLVTHGLVRSERATRKPSRDPLAKPTVRKNRQE